ncbi:MAG TPA: hypothetical protein VGI70_21615, partial [Polyangiales bacterium]
MAKAPSEVNSRLADELAARLARNPADSEAYRALHDHYAAVSDFASLTNLVAGFAAYSGDAAAATAAFIEAGQLAELRLDDSARAENYYRAALDRSPGDLVASSGLQALLERAERWSELVDLIVEQLALLERPTDRALLQYRLGELYSKQFGRLDTALTHYREAYELDPSLLRAYYEARAIHLEQGDIRAACTLYEKEAALEFDASRRTLLLKELAVCCEQIGDEDGAVSALERARALASDDAQLSHALASALVRRSAREDERTRALDLDRVADLLSDIAAGLPPTEARTFLESALGHAPWHARALYELEQITPDLERSSLAAHWVEYLANNPDGDLAQERRVSLARAYLAAEQIDDAIFTLEPAAKSGNVDALALLAQLRPDAAARTTPRAEPFPLPLEDDDMLVESDELELAAPSTPPPSAAASSSTEAHLPPMAASAAQTIDYQRLDAPAPARPAPPSDVTSVGEAPERETPEPIVGAESALYEPEALADFGSTALDARAPSDEPSDVDSYVDAEELATPIEDLSDSHIDLQPMAADELEVMRRNMAGAIAAADLDEALLLAERILRHEPGDSAAFEIAERAYKRSRDFRQRAELLVRSAQSDALDLTTRRQRLRDAIGLFEQKLLDIDSALRAYRSLIELEPDSEDPLRALARLLERNTRWSDLVQCVEAQLALQTEAPQQVALLRRISELHRRERKDRNAAADALLRLIAIDPSDRAARVALTEDLNALGRFLELTRLLQQRAEEAPNRAE